MTTKVESLSVPAARRRRKKISIVPYLFIAPHFLFFTAFLAWPFFYGIYISLFRFDFLQPKNRPFVGLKNYIDLFNPKSVPYEKFWNSLGNTAEFILWSVLPLVGIALLLLTPIRSFLGTSFLTPFGGKIVLLPPGLSISTFAFFAKRSKGTRRSQPT